MWKVARRLLLGCGLIGMCSAVLLFSDWNQRQAGRGRGLRLAIVQNASQAVLDEGVEGMIDALASEGLVDGRNLSIQRFNAENDLPTANAIARNVTNGDYDLVLTASTVSMQTVANANREGRTRHVFGVVADPFSAGIGLDRDNPAAHPRHLTGIGSFMPVSKTIATARQMFPGLRTIGLPWNAAESNSLAFTKLARAACEKMGITLLEANVENANGVGEAAASLVARGAQALFVSGDVTVAIGLEQVVTAARQGRIPVFSLLPPAVKRGTLFDLGANFYEIGRDTGTLAAKVLQGADPAAIPIRNTVPERIAVNRLALAGLKDPWTLPEELVARADVIVDASGAREKNAARVPQPAPGRTYKIGLVYFAPEPGSDSCMRGLFDGLKELGFVEGKNLEVRRAHAQAEIGNIPALLQNYDNSDVDLVMTLTTPCLTAACNTVKKKPVVFTYVSDPIAAGAGKSLTEHVPHVTGVGSFPPVAETVAMIRQVVPGVKAVGTIYNNAEANSRKVVSVGRELFRKEGIRFEEVAVTTTAEVMQAAQVVASRSIQAIWINGDNTALQAFNAIAKVALDHKLPVFLNDPDFVEQGALAAMGLGYYPAGRAAARLAARVLLGESPRHLPMENVVVKQVLLNDKVAGQLGITFPEALRKEAAR